MGLAPGQVDSFDVKTTTSLALDVTIKAEEIFAMVGEIDKRSSLQLIVGR